MTARELLEWWRQRAIEDGHAISTLDILVFEVAEDARIRGISSGTLRKAAGGNLRDYFRQAILSRTPAGNVGTGIEDSGRVKKV